MKRIATQLVVIITFLLLNIISLSGQTVSEIEQLIQASKTAFHTIDQLQERQKLRDVKARKEKIIQARNDSILWANKQKRKVSLINIYGVRDGNRIFNKQFWIGMTTEMARESIGYPNSNNRSVGSWGNHEQWVYKERDLILYFENGILTSWQD